MRPALERKRTGCQAPIPETAVAETAPKATSGSSAPQAPGGETDTAHGPVSVRHLPFVCNLVTPFAPFVAIETRLVSIRTIGSPLSSFLRHIFNSFAMQRDTLFPARRSLQRPLIIDPLRRESKYSNLFRSTW